MRQNIDKGLLVLLDHADLFAPLKVQRRVGDYYHAVLDSGLRGHDSMLLGPHWRSAAEQLQAWLSLDPASSR